MKGLSGILLIGFLRKYESIDDSFMKRQKPVAGVYAHREWI